MLGHLLGSRGALRRPGERIVRGMRLLLVEIAAAALVIGEDAAEQRVWGVELGLRLSLRGLLVQQFVKRATWVLLVTFAGMRRGQLKA